MAVEQCSRFCHFMRLSLVLFCANLVSSSGVPVFIWSSEEHNLPSAYVGEQTNKATFKSNYLEEILQTAEHDILVFLQDKLSLEDVTQNGDVYNTNGDGDVFKGLKGLVDSHVSAQLPDVEGVHDALNDVKRKFEGKVHDLHAPFDLKQLALSQDGKNLVFVHLPPTGQDTKSFRQSLSQVDKVISSVHSQYKGLKKRFTSLYTAKKPTHELTSGFYLGRHLLAEDDSNTTFINIKDCLYFYARAVKFEIKTDKGHKLSWTLNKLVYNDTEATKEAVEGSDCSGNEATLKVNWPLTEELKETLLDFKFDMRLVSKLGGYWQVVNVTLDYTVKVNGSQAQISNVNTPMNGKFIKAPVKFSYHCTEPRPIVQFNTTSSDRVMIQLEGFQMQFGNLTGAFGRPDDCVGVFTIPILSGILVSLVLIAILSYGIAMLININTMDRFDDPKGKTITVNTGE